jgi:Dolichyl-phosphate-mannose-protein mannosyltransferase
MTPAQPLPPSAERSAQPWAGPSLPALLALLIALAACGWLAREVAESQWVMDADEAVHAVEALRRFDRLEHGRIAQFLIDSYLPERWQPPVQDHVRWYAIVHSWSMLPAFALFGPSDVSARMVSVVYLLASCWVLYALAKRLAPSRPEWAGLVAVGLLLTAPNVITFTPQALTEPCTLFWCLLALLAYVHFVEQPDVRRRAVLAGAALATAILTKYDHGLLLIVCLGAAELVRFGGRAHRMLVSPSLWVFLIPAVVLGLWLAHPAKLQAFLDTLEHPAYGTWRVIVAEFAGSWVYESSSSFGALALIAATFAFARTRLSDARLRAVWMYALLSAVLLTLRARFHFRYNLIELTAFFALAGAMTPAAFESAARWMADCAARKRHLLGLVLGLAGTLVLSLAWLAIDQPQRVGALLRGVLSAILGDTPGRFGLSRPAVEYAQSLQDALAGATKLCGVSAITLGAALLALGAWSAMASAGTARGLHHRVLSTVTLLAILPGAAAFWARAQGAVRWEWEATPALHELIAKVADQVPVPGKVLLGGGWDQLANNTLRWYLLTRELKPRPSFDDVQVVGDMIGSLVLPEAPRIEWWARELREAPVAECPERVVLLDWRDDFLYREDIGPEVPLYRAILEQRRCYELAERVPFDELGLDLEVWRRRSESVPPLLEPKGAAAASGTSPQKRATVGRWSISDRSWRHLDCPWLE